MTKEYNELISQLDRMADNPLLEEEDLLRYGSIRVSLMKGAKKVAKKIEKELEKEIDNARVGINGEG